MRQLFELLPIVAASDSTVLIEGASGTGKELVARAIHDLSRRSARRFRGRQLRRPCPTRSSSRSCSATRPGAFTDAKKDKPGRFALAQGGTILLDEIGDISPALQTRLLRVSAGARL